MAWMQLKVKEGLGKKQLLQIAPDFRLPSRREKARIVLLCKSFRNVEGGRKDQQDVIVIY